MLKDILGKSVLISLGSTDFSNVVKGEVIDVSETWLKVQTKKTLELIRVNAIVKISIAQK